MGVGLSTICFQGIPSKEIAHEHVADVEAFAVLGKRGDAKFHVPVLGQTQDPVSAKAMQQALNTGASLATSGSQILDETEFEELTERLRSGPLAKILFGEGLPRPCPGDGQQRCCEPHAPGRPPPIQPAPIVFLDVDGVLHGVGAPFRELFGQQQLENLRRLVCAIPGAQIVLSTAWRLSDGSTQRVLSELFRAGLPMPISSTPNLLPGEVRGRSEEIAAWLRSHEHLVQEGRWLAIDDIPLSPDLPAEHVLTTDCYKGLTTAKADEGIEKLARRPV